MALLRWRRAGGPAGDLKGRMLFVLLLATLIAQHWFASTPLPLGGPNVVLGGLTALLALSLVILRLFRGEGSCVGLPMLRAAFRPAAPVIALSLLLLGWALAVHLRTGTSAPVRLAQIVLGIGVLCATCLCLDSVRRAALMALAFVAATFASAAFGLAVAFIGEPFLSLWLKVADVQPGFLHELWRSRRLAGLSADPPAFGYQLAVAVPLAFAALLHSPAGRGRMARAGWAAAFYLMLMTLVVALAIDGSRFAILACALGCAIVILMSMRMPHVRRRLPLVAVALAIGLVAVFNPLFSIAWAAGGTGDADAWPAIEGLEAGSGGLMRDSPDQPLVVAEIRRLNPEAKYRVQVRARQRGQPGPASEIVAAPGSLGAIFLSWRMPEGTPVAGYESRVRAEGALAWTRWAPVYVHRGAGLTTEAIAAQIRLLGRRHEWKPNRQIFWWSSPSYEWKPDWQILWRSSPSVLSRLHMARIAWQHALQHPLGAGRYAPAKSALSAEMLEKNSAAMQYLQGDPHNQFLFVLADYGFPGLILLALFYFWALRSPILAAKAANPSSDGTLLLLAAAIGGGLIAYALHSLGHGRGPFTGDWGHFLMVGLAIAIQRIAAARGALGRSVRHARSLATGDL